MRQDKIIKKEKIRNVLFTFKKELNRMIKKRNQELSSSGLPLRQGGFCLIGKQ